MSQQTWGWIYTRDLYAEIACRMYLENLGNLACLRIEKETKSYDQTSLSSFFFHPCVKS